MGTTAAGKLLGDELPPGRPSRLVGQKINAPIAVVPVAQALGWKRLSRRLFVTTDTLENAMAAEATIGDSSQPVQG